MRGLASTVILGLLLPVSGVASVAVPNPFPETLPLPVEARNPVVLNARLDLEMRRAGGPRRHIVEQLLLDGRTDDAFWSMKVTRACLAWVVDCARFLPLVEQMPEHLSGDARKSVEYDAGLLRREAYVQAMSANQRRDVYLRALEGFPIGDPQVSWLDADTAALRALEEGHDDLIPAIRRVLNGRLKANREPIEMHLRVREASISRRAGDTLLRLVQEGVGWDVERLLAQPPMWNMDRLLAESKRPKAGARHDEVPLGVARLALDELRRVNPPGAREGLKEALTLYKPAEEKRIRDREEGLAREKRIEARGGQAVTLKVPPEKALDGRLSRDIVEAIGDLGDRDYERAVFKDLLGGRLTLWDRVNKVEGELVKQGKMKVSEMVSGEQP